MKVVFLSTLAGTSKWYEGAKVLPGEEVAKHMETLINDELHKGYRFTNSMLAFEKIGGYGHLASGMYLYFEQIS